MADAFEIKITGLKEVQKALYSYSQQLGDKVVIAALTQGARLVQRAAKTRAPVITGRLKRGIVVRKSKINNGRRRELIGVYMTLRKGKGKKDPKDAFYGSFIEDGFTARGGRVISGKEFIKGAFRGTRDAAVRLIVQSAERGAEIVKRKVGLR